MPQIYTTQAERYILSFFPNHRFEAENRQYHHDFTLPKLVKELRDEYGYDDADTILDYVITRVERKYDRAKSRLKKWEIGCYLTFLKKVQWQLRDLAKQAEAKRAEDGLMAKMLRFYRGEKPDLRIVGE